MPHQSDGQMRGTGGGMDKGIGGRADGSAARLRAAVLALLVAGAGFVAAPARAEQLGPSTGLPLPRYVSLKSGQVNLREGPSRNHRTTWVFQRAGLPVEITAEFDVWRKIRDSDGAEGWVLHSLLSGRRTALVAPWKKEVLLKLQAGSADDARVLANLQPGVLANVKRCEAGWCRVWGEGFDGYMKQVDLWGVYPDEKVD